MNGLINWQAILNISSPPIPRGENHSPAMFWGRVAKMYDGMAKLEEGFTKNQIELMTLTKEDSVVDIGCGPGRLSIPIAHKVNRVTAVDVADEMLESCMKNAGEQGLKNITPVKINWTDKDAVEKIGKHDIAIASRSVGFSDIQKLNAIATKFVYVLCFANSPSLKDIHSDFVVGVTEEEKERQINPYERMLGYNAIFNQVYDMGANPSVVVVPDGFERHYISKEEAYEDLRFVADIPPDKEERYRQNIDRYLTPKPDGGFHLLRKTKSYVMWWRPDEIQNP